MEVGDNTHKWAGKYTQLAVLSGRGPTNPCLGQLSIASICVGGRGEGGGIRRIGNGLGGIRETVYIRNVY